MRSYLGKLALRTDNQWEFWPQGWNEPIIVTESDAPLETDIEAFIEDGRIVEWERDYSQPAGMRDTTRKNVALLVMTTADKKEQNRKAITDSAREVQNEKRFYFGDHYVINVTPIDVVVENPDDFGLNGPWPTIWEAMEAQTKYSRDDFNYWHITNVPIKPGYSGWAYHDSDKGATNYPGNVPTIVHELGHQWGPGHVAKANGAPYFDTRMGQARTSWEFCAAHRHHMGLIEPERVAEIQADNSKAFALVTASTTACRPGEKQIVYVRTPDMLYSVSVLMDEVRIESGATGGAIKEPTWRGVFHHRSLQEGESWMGMTVDYLGWGEATVSFNGASITATDFTLPDEVSPITAGHFHDPDKTHQGAQIYRSTLDDGTEQALIDWFTWDSSGPLFLTAQGPIENDIARLTIYYTDNRELVEVGSGILYFRDDNFATFKYRLTLKDKWWPGPGILQLTRLTKPLDFSRWKTGEREGVSWQDVPPNPNLPNGAELVMDWYQEFDRNTRTYRPRWRYGENGILYEPFGGVANIKTESGIRRWGRYKITGDTFRYRKDGWGDWKSDPLLRLI